VEVLSEGRTIEEALQEAARRLEAEPGRLDYEILQKPSRGLLGVGAKPAIIKATLLADPVNLLGRLLEKTSELMGFSVEMSLREENNVLFADLKPDDSPGLLVGRGGECLHALQHLAGRMLGMKLGTKARVVVDVAGYRKRRAQSLTRKARRIAEQVKTTGRKVTLDPLWAADRRVIHLALKDDPAVTTRADGEGLYKRVTILPVEPGERGLADRK
jgi:spoIIIJ-associated protein